MQSDIQSNTKIQCTYTMDVAKTFNNQCQRLPVVPHTAQQEDHVQHQISLFANVVCLKPIKYGDVRNIKSCKYHLEIVVLAGAQKVDQSRCCEFCIQFYLPNVTYKT